MLVLGIETATWVGGVGLIEDQQVIAEYTWHTGRTHSEMLVPLVRRMMEDARRELADLDGVAVSIGPGSFTGLRIGLSTAKGLCFSLGCPLVAVPTLDALASRMLFSAYPVCCMLDARKKEVYAAIYDTSEGVLQRQWGPEAIDPDRAAHRLCRTAVFVGTGATLYRERILSLANDARFAPGELNAPSAVAVARLGLGALEEGDRVDLAGIEPMYLRSSEAELAEERRRTCAGS